MEDENSLHVTVIKLRRYSNTKYPILTYTFSIKMGHNLLISYVIEQIFDKHLPLIYYDFSTFFYRYPFNLKALEKIYNKFFFRLFTKTYITFSLYLKQCVCVFLAIDRKI